MTKVVLPKLNQTGKNEWADVEDNDVAIREVINGELDNDNLKTGAGITGAKLADETIEAAKIAKETLSADRLASGVALTNLAAQSVTGEKLAVAGASYGAPSELASGEEFEPNATRPTWVSLAAVSKGEQGGRLKVEVGGVLIAQNVGLASLPAGGTYNHGTALGFFCPAAKKCKATIELASSEPKIIVSYLVV